MSIDLRHLRCFVAVAEDLHFHKAAKRLGVAQPALSRTIQNLERALGVQLFTRSNRSVAITVAGQTLLKGCTEILGKTQRMIEDVQRAHEGTLGTLRMGYTDNAMNGRAPELIKAFRKAQPDIDVLLTHAITSDQLIALEDGALDFGFATGSAAHAGYDQICIQRERFVCVVYDGHRFENRDSVSIEDLANEPLVRGVASEWEFFHSHLRSSFRQAGFEPVIAQEGATTSDIQRLVACGIGVSILTDTVADTLASGLKVVPLTGVTEQLSTMVLWKAEQTNAAKEHFVAFLNRTELALPDT